MKQQTPESAPPAKPDELVQPGKGMTWKEFVKSLGAEWSRDKLGDTAAALTFYIVQALFPFMLFLVAMAGLVIKPEQAQSLIQSLAAVAPPAVTQILADRLHAITTGPSVGLLTIGGLGTVVSASSGIVAMMDALNTVYGVEDKRSFIKRRFIALLMTLGAAVVAILSALAAVAAPAVADKLGEPWSTIISIARLPVAGILMMGLWATLYYVLPDVEQKFRFISVGSLTGVVLWLIASWGFSMYVTHFGSYDATYGTLGGVIVMLIWMWISAQVVLLGAEINAVLEHKSPSGKAAGAHTLAEKGPLGTKSELEDKASRFPGAPLPVGPSAAPPAPPRPHRSLLTGKVQRPKVEHVNFWATVWAAGAGLGLMLMRRSRKA